MDAVYVTDHQRSSYHSYRRDLCWQRPSTVCTSSRRNLKLSAIIMQQPASWPTQHGWKQSRTNNSCPGEALRPTHSTSTARNWKRYIRAAAGKHAVDSGQSSNINKQQWQQGWQNPRYSLSLPNDKTENNLQSFWPRRQGPAQDVHRLDREVSQEIKLWPLVHHGTNWNG